MSEPLLWNCPVFGLNRRLLWLQFRAITDVRFYKIIYLRLYKCTAITGGQPPQSRKCTVVKCSL